MQRNPELDASYSTICRLITKQVGRWKWRQLTSKNTKFQAEEQGIRLSVTRTVFRTRPSYSLEIFDLTKRWGHLTLVYYYDDGGQDELRQLFDEVQKVAVYAPRTRPSQKTPLSEVLCNLIKLLEEKPAH